jgi:uncharacterized membrane protein
VKGEAGGTFGARSCSPVTRADPIVVGCNLVSLPRGENSVPTTAWRFPDTEGADNAVVRLKLLDSQDLINLMDIAVLRWPGYAAEPTTQEHVHEQGGKMASMVRRLQRPVIDGAMIESVKGDLRPGTSAVVLLSSGAEIDAVVHAFEGQPIELIRSDLSVPDQDRLRQAVAQARQREPGEGSLSASTRARPCPVILRRVGDLSVALASSVLKVRKPRRW